MTNKLEKDQLISYATEREDWDRDVIERLLFKCARKMNAEYRHASFFDNPSAYMQMGDVERQQIEEMLQQQALPSSEIKEQG